MTERPTTPERYKDPLQVYAEADPETRAVIEKELDRIDTLDQRDAELNARGLNYGVVVTLAFLAACVYLIASGRMCVAGLNASNVQRVAQAFAAVM